MTAVQHDTRFLVTGDLNLDLIIKDLEAMPDPGQELFIPDVYFSVGGSAANTAVALAKLGEQVSLHGYRSDDYFSQYISKTLEEMGVDTSLLQVVAGYKTGLSIALTSSKDRSFISYQGSNAAYRPLIPAGELKHFTHLHISALNWKINLAAYRQLLQAAREQGLSTSLDTGWSEFAAMREEILGLLTLVDIFFPNEAEALALTGKESWEKALKVLGEQVRVAVITRGRRGVAVQSERERFSLPAFAVQSVDAVGAGDAFAAGFLSAYSKGWDLKKCALWASACGALAATRWGGATGAPTAAEVQAFFTEKGIGC
ncbi:MAG: carbohydrate kinase family protein [Moorella humiferrea]|nr:carbohydrate kinase family protein [Moorella humiferrea]